MPAQIQEETLYWKLWKDFADTEQVIRNGQIRVNDSETDNWYRVYDTDGHIRADGAGEFPAMGIVVAGGDDTDPAIILTRGVVRNEGR